jgi:fido (protein-threonine AMPylation protein)
MNDRKLLYDCFYSYTEKSKEKESYLKNEYLCKNLIKFYYSTNDDVKFDLMKEKFVKKYIYNENEVEEVHEKAERKGLRKMYNFIHEEDYILDIYTLLELHEKLFYYAPNKDFGGHFRNIDVYLPGTGNELSEWSFIRYKIIELKNYVNDLIEEGKNLRNTKDFDKLFMYVEKCIVLKCKLIKIHPFFDGNGRTIRGFINILLELANIPPVYIKKDEKIIYHNAMNKANCEKDYSNIIKFYYHKICDSIVELELSNMKKQSIEVKKLNMKKEEN